MSFRRWIRRIKVYDERSRRMSDSFAIFIDKDGFRVLKRRGLSGFPRPGEPDPWYDYEFFLPRMLSGFL